MPAEYLPLTGIVSLSLSLPGFPGPVDPPSLSADAILTSFPRAFIPEGLSGHRARHRTTVALRPHLTDNLRFVIHASLMQLLLPYRKALAPNLLVNSSRISQTQIPQDLAHEAGIQEKFDNSDATVLST